MLTARPTSRYECFYSPGMGPIPFSYSAESFPITCRDVGMSLATAILWLFNFVLAFTFPLLQAAFTSTGAFGFYAAWCIVLWFAVILFMPETKGTSSHVRGVGATLTHPQNSPSKNSIKSSPFPPTSTRHTRSKTRSTTSAATSSSIRRLPPCLRCTRAVRSSARAVSQACRRRGCRSRHIGGVDMSLELGEYLAVS